jgi:hypothetical protein
MALDTDELHGVGAAFPFLMVLASFFITGFVFILFDVPLLLRAVGNQQYETVYDAALALWDDWAVLLKSNPGAGFVLMFCIVALIAGMAVQQVSTLIVSVIGGIVSIVIRRVRKGRGTTPFYSAMVSFGVEDAQFKAWLHKHRVAKLEWEWQLFLYYVYLGLCVNAMVASFAVSHTLRLGWPQTCWLVIICCVLVVYIFARSSVMGTVDRYYRTQSEKQ